jgi:hypothetical protein
MESVIDQRKPARLSALTVLFFLLLIVAELLLVFGKSLDHDEHQFVASGVLLARRGLLPYRDYPYFHTPNLSFVYALLFRLSDHLLLCARLFNAACELLVVVIVYVVARRCFGWLSASQRSAAAIGAVLLLITNPLFTQTSGRAWNHDLPVLLCVLAFFCASAAHQSHSNRWAGLCGLLLGAAIGTRLTFAPAFLVFAGMLLGSSAKEQATSIAERRDEGPAHRRVAKTFKPASTRAAVRLALFLLGLLLGLIPTLTLLLIAPRQFIFGNFQYPVLNTAFRMAGQHRHEFNTGITNHLSYVLLHFVLQPGTLLLLALLFWSLWLARRSGSEQYRLQRTYLPVLLLFLLPGALAPTPAFAQYFYVLVPFVILWIIYLLSAAMQIDQRMRQWKLLGAVAAVCIIAGVPMYMPEKHWNLANSAPLLIHGEGIEIAQLAGGGKVLTLTPIYPLEGGCDIYESYATGPFAARIAPMLDDKQLQVIHLRNERQLLDGLRADPPAAVLAGSEGDTDQPLRAYARSVFAWRTVRISRLWLWVHQAPAEAGSRTAIAQHH